MNTVNCTAGLFTDNFFIPLSASPPCSQSVQGFLAFSLFFAITRVFLGLPIFLRTTSVQQKKHQKHASQRFKDSSLPTLPLHLLVSLIGLVQILYVVLSSQDVINFSNGLGPFVGGGILLPLIAIEQYQQIKIVVRLGKKIVPLSLKAYKFDESLARDDVYLRILFWGLKISAFLAFLFFLIFACLQARDIWSFQTALICCGFYEIFATVSVCWQFERCIKAIHVLINDSVQLNSTAEKAPVIRAEKKMRSLQLVVFFFGSVEVVLAFLFGSLVVPLYWFVFVTLFFALDVCLETCLILITLPGGGKKRIDSKKIVEDTLGNQTHVNNNTVVNSATALSSAHNNNPPSVSGY